MDALPHLVLENILLQTKLTSQGALVHLPHCARVSRKWHDAASPLLYGIVALDINRLASFIDKFNARRYASHVLSLTLRMETEPQIWVRWLTENAAPHPILTDRISHLIPLLRRLHRLRVFSLYVPTSCIVASEIICTLLQNLPQACTALELDTLGRDRFTSGTEPMTPEDHICTSVRNLLPQLAHVKIRTRRMCSALFDARYDPGDTRTPREDASMSQSHVLMPELRTMMISMGYRGYFCRPCYGEMRQAASWLSVARALETAVKDTLHGDASLHGETSDHPRWQSHRPNPTIKLVGIVLHEGDDEDDMTLWPTVIRADMVDKEAWAIPVRSIWEEHDVPWANVLQGSNSILLPDGEELVASMRRVETLAEGDAANWCTIAGGARVPRDALLASGNDTAVSMRRIAELAGGWASVVEESPLPTTPEQWREEHQPSMAPHWVNETRAGMKLIQAERRVGSKEYLSFRPVFELTPGGFERGRGGVFLRRIGSDDEI